MKNIPVLFENESCLVLDKPSGLAVQGGEGVGISLDSILSESYSPRPLLVHRIDKDTSGLILVAKNRDAAAFFSSLWNENGKNRIKKQYLAVVFGVPVPEKGIIRLDLDIKGQFKKSETAYQLVSSSDKTYSLLELELGTGRMHQIRRHLMLIKNPVLGDDKYGDFSMNKKLKKTMGLKKLLLHASRLFMPPCKLFPQGLDISSDLPDYFNPFL